MVSDWLQLAIIWGAVGILYSISFCLLAAEKRFNKAASVEVLQSMPCKQKIIWWFFPYHFLGIIDLAHQTESIDLDLSSPSQVMVMTNVKSTCASQLLFDNHRYRSTNNKQLKLTKLRSQLQYVTGGSAKRGLIAFPIVCIWLPTLQHVSMSPTWNLVTLHS